jgi:hypothetical protein
MRANNLSMREADQGVARIFLPPSQHLGKQKEVAAAAPQTDYFKR